MLSAKFLVVFILLLSQFQNEAESWRRRRRRRSRTPQDCQVSSWHSWNSCSVSKCGRQGSQSRSRSIMGYASCGGASCSKLHESRQCYGSTPENCQLSWRSQWSACIAKKWVQTSTRHRISTEKCGEWRTSTFRKTRMCPSAPDNCSQGLYEWFRLAVNCTLFES